MREFFLKNDKYSKRISKTVYCSLLLNYNTISMLKDKKLPILNYWLIQILPEAWHTVIMMTTSSPIIQKSIECIELLSKANLECHLVDY